MEIQKQLKIYWQKQGADQLCGVHCINTLLQTPAYDQISLANIAIQLDQKQKQLMSEQGHQTQDFKKYMAQESGNVGLYGNFSLQVLTQSLKQIDKNLQVISIKILQVDLSKQNAFICNCDNHWLSIRKINNIWYNLNSTNKVMPEIIKDQQLLAFFKQAKQAGFEIFSVKGLPIAVKNYQDIKLKPNQIFYTSTGIKQYQQKRLKKLKKNKITLNLYGYDHMQMKKAIARSLGQEVQSSQEQQIQQIKPSKFKLLFQKAIVINYEKFSTFKDLDYFFMIRQSLQQEFKNQPKQGITGIFLLPNQTQLISRKFKPNSLIESLYDFVFLKSTETFPEGIYTFYLKLVKTEQILSDVSVPLQMVASQQGKIQIEVCKIRG